MQIWIRDVASPAFIEAAHLQSRAVAASERAAGNQDFVQAISIWPED